MAELINGRTPEEIKRNLSYLVRCENCPQNHEYGCDYDKQTEECRTVNDAIVLIERLEAKVPKWIGVDERLPKNEESVIIAGWREGISGKLCPVVMTAFHVDGEMLAQYSKYAWSDGNIELKYDEDADDFIVPKGWFEDVQCADEFSMVDGIRVTHWMPLPEPQEVKSK